MLGLACQSRLLLFVTGALWLQAKGLGQLSSGAMADDLDRIQQALPLSDAGDQGIASWAFLHGLQSIYLCSALILLATTWICRRLLRQRLTAAS